MFNFALEPKKNDVDYTIIYDFIALGLGPAGFNGALYAKRKGLKTLVIGNEVGGQLKNTTDVDNYLGFGLIDAADLITKFTTHLSKLEVPMVTEVIITGLEKQNNVFIIKLSNGKTLKSKTVLYALGGSSRKLAVPGEERLNGKGISYCVTCDGPFFKDKSVVVAGGGNSAVDAALDLARIAKKVTIIHRSQFRADQESLDQLLKMPNVEVYLETQILKINGEKGVESLTILDKETNEQREFEAEGLFIEIGTIPNSKLLTELLKLSLNEEVKVNCKQQTTVPGLYAAGDVTHTPHKQIIIAASEGAKAALDAALYINRN